MTESKAQTNKIPDVNIVPQIHSVPKCTSLDMYKLLEDNNCVEDFHKYQLAEDDNICEENFNQVNLKNEEKPIKNKGGGKESALIKYEEMVICKSKEIINYFRTDFRYDDFVPRAELEPEDKDIENSENANPNFCCIQPSFVLLISLIQLIFLLIDFDGFILRFECLHKTEVWRFWTYFLVYDRYYNVYYPLTDMLIQLLVGFPMEKVHKRYRVMIIYMTGVLSGSLLQSVYNRDILVGGRGGVYALLTSHAINVYMNRKQLAFPLRQLGLIGFFFVFDICWYKMDVFGWRWFFNDGILAHIGGIMAGILIGIHVLRSNINIDVTEKYVKYTSFSLVLLLVGTAVVIDCVLLR